MPESYYTPKHQYEMMVIEGTRLLGLPDKNNNCAYGSCTSCLSQQAQNLS